MTDLCELKRHIYGDSIDRSVISRFVDMLFPVCDCQQLMLKQQQQQQQQNDLYSNELESMFSQEFDFDDPLNATCDDEDDNDKMNGSLSPGNQYMILSVWLFERKSQVSDSNK